MFRYRCFDRRFSVLVMIRHPYVSANLKQRLLAEGSALSITVDRFEVWEGTNLVRLSFSATRTEVRVLGALSSGNIAACSSGGSPR